MADLDAQDLNFGETPIGEIAVQFPGATAIFRRHKLDYCCGGAISLADAVRRRGIVLADVERQLTQLIPHQTDLPDDSEGIIDHIISRYHDTHRRELPELMRLARRVERVHAEHPQAPTGLSDFLEQMDADLGSHMDKEELVLFPMIRAEHRMAIAPIAMMRAEHVNHGLALEELAALTHDMQPPQGACGSWQALYSGLRKLASDLIDHIHIENNILFKRFAG
jgi:regulator of cell morphogenesis and NO signaling